MNDKINVVDFYIRDDDINPNEYSDKKLEKESLLLINNENISEIIQDNPLYVLDKFYDLFWAESIVSDWEINVVYDHLDLVWGHDKIIDSEGNLDFKLLQVAINKLIKLNKELPYDYILSWKLENKYEKEFELKEWDKTNKILETSDWKMAFNVDKVRKLLTIYMTTILYFRNHLNDKFEPKDQSSKRIQWSDYFQALRNIDVKRDKYMENLIDEVNKKTWIPKDYISYDDKRNIFIFKQWQEIIKHMRSEDFEFTYKNTKEDIKKLQDEIQKSQKIKRKKK